MQVAKPRRRSDSALLMVDSDLVKGVSIVLPATQVFSHSSELLAIIKVPNPSPPRGLTGSHLPRSR